MIASPFPQPPVRGAATGCGIAGHATCAARLSGIVALRDGGIPPGAPPLPARFLRHCDEQTVVGIHAVLQSIAALPAPVDLAADAIVAAPCQAGRLMAAKSLCLLKTGGAVTVSTHIVPQASLHSIAGAVSVALGMHGPHLGVGGGADALAEGFLAAATLVGSAGLPRVWLVATEWDEEPLLDPAGDAATDPLCRAVALAIEPGGHGALGLDVHFATTPSAAVDPTRLATFASALDACGPGGVLAAWTLSAPGGAEVRITRGRDRGIQAFAAERRREAA
ncbi:MAG: hypothetical protein ACKOC4_03905 [Planctomycetia bacterium]